MAEEADLPPDGPALGRQLVAEHDGPARGHAHQCGADPQERGLAGPVRPRQEHDLASADVEIHPGQGRETTEDGHDGAKLDDPVHSDRPKA